MKQVWAALYRVGPKGKEWYKDTDGIIVRRALGWREVGADIFNSTTAQQLKLKHCTKLGELGFLDLPEGEWDSFRHELVVLAQQSDDKFRRTPLVDWAGKLITDGQHVQMVTARALEFLDLADRLRGQGYTISIGSE